MRGWEGLCYNNLEDMEEDLISVSLRNLPQHIHIDSWGKPRGCMLFGGLFITMPPITGVSEQ